MVCKVVSIEDEPEIAELLRIVLSSPEIEVYSCDNGPDGVQLIRACKPDLVILDIMLPGMNGWAVYDVIRSDEEVKATPIVMLSVLREEPGRRRAFVGSPIDLYVTKPFDTVRLRGDIERMLGRKGLWPVTKPLFRPAESDPPGDKPTENPADKSAAEPPLFGNGSHDVKPAAAEVMPIIGPEQTASAPGGAAEQTPTSAQSDAAEQSTVSVESPAAEQTTTPAKDVVVTSAQPAPPTENNDEPAQPVSETPAITTSEPRAEEPAVSSESNSDSSPSAASRLQ